MTYTMYVYENGCSVFGASGTLAEVQNEANRQVLFLSHKNPLAKISVDFLPEQ